MRQSQLLQPRQLRLQLQQQLVRYCLIDLVVRALIGDGTKNATIVADGTQPRKQSDGLHSRKHSRNKSTDRAQ